MIRTLPWPLHAGIYRKPSVYGFVKLTRSLALRTVSGCKPRYRTCLLGVGPCVGALAGHLEPSIHAHAYTRDIRNFVLTHLWATILDLQVYRDVWPEGVELAESSSCNQERETGQKVAMRTSVLGNRFFVAPKICSVIGINPAQEAARPAQQVLCKTV